MSTKLTCSCSVKELIEHEITGQPHTDCQAGPYNPTQHNSAEPPALNSDALTSSVTAALGASTTTTL